MKRLGTKLGLFPIYNGFTPDFENIFQNLKLFPDLLGNIPLPIEVI